MDNADNKGAVVADRLALQAEDQQQILLDRWQPANEKPATDVTCRAVIQILHGLGEHTARYERFAQACATAGIVTVAHNHRGHGEHCVPEQLGHFADSDGWNKVVEDAQLVRRHLLEHYADIPLVVLGHSMGSYIAQCSVMRDPRGVSALILSATTSPPRAQVRVARMLARIESLFNGGNTKSTRLNRMSFGDFNNEFAPNRSAFDWLSRDKHEVDKYIADPACGAVPSSRLWYDLTGGLLEISTRRALRAVPSTLPVLITGGQLDPVGGQSGLSKLATRYRKTGHTDLTLKIYKDGRHEMLNEINRDEVTEDIVRWILKHSEIRG
jgi:alpha-beta hydrolase superfamily lysophospholipase